jgi:hypothetical protein
MENLWGIPTSQSTQRSDSELDNIADLSNRYTDIDRLSRLIEIGMDI